MTLLGHYYSPDQAAAIREAGLIDWLKLLAGLSRDGIAHACESYLRDQPRRRPTPGDIFARARSFDDERQRSRAITEGRSPDFDKVAKWAERTGRLSREQAFEAMSSDRGSRALPAWMPDGEIQRLVYLCRQHPAYIPQGDEAKAS